MPSILHPVGSNAFAADAYTCHRRDVRGDDLNTWIHAAQFPLPPAPLTLAVSHRAKVIRPGDVVLVTAVSSAPAATVEGTAFGRRVAFWRKASSEEWRGARRRPARHAGPHP